MSVIVFAYQLFYARKSNVRFFRYKIELDILVDV